MAAAFPSDKFRVARLVSIVLRGTFRLILGLAAGGCVAYSVLWLAEQALVHGTLGSVDSPASSVWVALTVAVALGIAAAVAVDRLWIRLRAVGASLRRF